MSRPPKTYDNSEVRAFLDPFYTPSDLCEVYPQIDDIFTGLLTARTAGDSSVRSLSRKVLFRILSECETIDAASVERVTRGRLAPRTVRSYAALARSTSCFIRTFADRRMARGVNELRQPV